MEYIGIKFSDNDYRTTLRVFMQALKEFVCDFGHEFTKEQIVMWFNKSSEGLYWAFQAPIHHSIDVHSIDKKIRQDAQAPRTTGQYLQIKVTNVYFDMEVLEMVVEGDQNAEFQYLDVISGELHMI